MKEERAARVVETPRCSPVVLKFLALYVSWQLILPLRHWLYPGSVSWTEEGPLFAWHMKLRSKSGRVRFYVMDDKGEDGRPGLI